VTFGGQITDEVGFSWIYKKKKKKMKPKS